MLLVPPGYNHGTQSILIVEDSGALLELLSEVFKMHGWNVIKAKNGLEGWNLFKNNQVDIVLTDILMPGLDGTELAHRIRNHSPYTKIALMTGGESEAAKKLLDDGTANYYFHKPFDLFQVCKSIVAETQAA